MAMTKSVALDTGVTIDHWLITHAAQDFQAGIIDLTVHGWLNEAAYAAEREPMAMRKMRVTVADLAAAGVSLELTAMLEPVVQAAIE